MRQKLEELFKIHGNKLVGIMYFIDPDLAKNKNFYISEIRRLNEYYKISIYLFYGKELFEFLKSPKYWDKLLDWLTKWKGSLPEIPEVNFDAKPQDSFEEIKDLEIRYWRQILENEKLWEEGIIKAIFRSGETLKMILNYFIKQTSPPYQKLSKLLKERLEKYY